MQIRELQKILSSGDNPYIDISDKKSVLLHYIEEVGELVKAIRKCKTYEDFHEKLIPEIGDQLILLCFVASSLSIDLESATLNKIRKNIENGKFNIEFHKELKSLFGDNK